jgi:hypothetical protein
MRADVASAYAALLAAAPAALAGASLSDFAAAASVVYSRAYGFRAAGGANGATAFLRVLLPLADMINHGGDEAPTHGPLYPPCRDAANMRWEIEELEELEDDGDGNAGAAGASAGGGTARFAMRVRACAPVAAGEEALFCYSEQSNDSFLLYYGFTPPANPHDDVVLWDDLEAALDWHAAAFPAVRDAEPRRAAARAAAAAAAARVAAGGDGALLAAEQRLKLLAGARLDARMVAALAALSAPSAGEAAALEAVHAAVCARCGELLTTLGDAPAGQDGGPVEQLLAHKRVVLREAMAALQPASDRA